MGWYFWYGIKTYFSCLTPLYTLITLEIDGKPIVLSKNITAIVVCNINSYMRGTDLWGSNRTCCVDTTFDKNSLNDGRVEVIAIRGIFHQAMIKLKCARARRIGQGKQVKIAFTDNKRNHGTFPIQIDGEPWMQETKDITIRHLNSVNMLQKQKKVLP